jgi:hypothetical protein
LINQIVRELTSLGFSPAVLQELLEHSKNEAEAVEGHYKADRGDPNLADPSTDATHSNLPKIVYEVESVSGRIEPRLRLWLHSPMSKAESGRLTPGPSSSTNSNTKSDSVVDHGVDRPNIRLLWALQQGPWVLAPDTYQHNSVVVVEPSIGRHISEVLTFK